MKSVNISVNEKYDNLSIKYSELSLQYENLVTELNLIEHDAIDKDNIIEKCE